MGTHERPSSAYGNELSVETYGRPRSRSHTGGNRPASVAGGGELHRRPAVQIFTEQQKQLLRSSWSHVGRRGHGGIGVMIFRRAFERRPALRQLFGFGSVPIDRLLYDPLFEVHARNFVSIFENAVRHLDDFDETFAPMLMDKGLFHAQFAERGLKCEYWDVFAEAMSESAIEWIGPGRHRETVRAWTLLISCIVDRMRRGYEDELRRRKKLSNRCPSPNPSNGAAGYEMAD